MLQRLYPYLILMRLHRPIGILLLSWPMLIALWLSSGGCPDLTLLLKFILGAVIMRSAGCVINDIFDRKLDGHIQRTKERPLVTGKVKLREAILLFMVLILMAFSLVCTLNVDSILLSFVAAFLAVFYPLTKRFIHFPQVILGATFGFAVPIAYSATSKHLPLVCWLLFSATLLWAVAYDTLYAMVDREDDKKIGIKSTAILFGKYDKFSVGVCHIGMFILLGLIGKEMHLGPFYFLGITAAQVLALYQQWLIRAGDPKKCFQAFLNNHWLGAILFLGTYLNGLIVF